MRVNQQAHQYLQANQLQHLYQLANQLAHQYLQAKALQRLCQLAKVLQLQHLTTRTQLLSQQARATLRQLVQAKVHQLL